MRYIRSANCAIYMMLIGLCFIFIKHEKNLWDYVLEKLESKSIDSIRVKYKCIFNWLYYSAINQLNAEKVLKLYHHIFSRVGDIKKKKIVLEVIESAIWMKDENVVHDMMSNYSEILDEKIKSKVKILLCWRFGYKECLTLDSINHLQSHGWFLPYLDIYAKASIYNSFGEYQKAEESYKLALRLLPHDTYEYQCAINEYNELLNK